MELKYRYFNFRSLTYRIEVKTHRSYILNNYDNNWTEVKTLSLKELKQYYTELNEIDLILYGIEE